VLRSLTRSKAYQRELYGWLISLGCNSGTPFYLNRQERVNAILVFLAVAHHAGHDVVNDSAARRGSVHAQWCEVGQDRSLINLSPLAIMFALAKTVTVWAAVWDEASASAQTWASASVWA